ncbi:MAG TPA: signal peptidase II [Asticcacaulis sp.]|nr:signal peptidase II [Asticcacaulis sp.]
MSSKPSDMIAAYMRARTTTAGLRALALAALVLVLDQASKLWVLHGLGFQQPGDSVTILPFFSFTYVQNIGISFGLFGSEGAGRWLLVTFQFAVALFLIGYVRSKSQPLLVTALALIIGGAIGNGLDRARLGFVVDFLDFSRTHVFPWVFNIADSGITIGVALLIWHFMRADKDQASQPDAG